MKYLLDTNVLSELMKEAPDQMVAEWVAQHEPETMMCTIVLAEIAAGIEALPDGKRRSALFREIRFIQEDYRERILSFDESAAWEWGRYIREVRDAGFSPPLLDSQIAAIAQAWGLTVVTRNVEDFPLLPTVNPFEA